jgi:hypothetical protein
MGVLQKSPLPPPFKPDPGNKQLATGNHLSSLHGTFDSQPFASEPPGTRQLATDNHTIMPREHWSFPQPKLQS